MQKSSLTSSLQEKIYYFSGLIGLALIGLYCALASIYYRSFAELNITFDFLNFPIFIGEILLMICAILFFIRLKIKPIELNKVAIAIIVFFIWVITKAILGYMSGGPLAFRHAALFYYAAFGIFAYNFYDSRYFSKKACIFLLILICFCKWSLGVFNYFILPYMFLGLVLLVRVNNLWLWLVFTPLLILTPEFNFKGSQFFTLDYFFFGARNRILAHIVSFLALVLLLSGAFIKINKKFRLTVIVIFLVLMVFGITRFVDKESVKSVTKLSETINGYKYFKQYINNKKLTHERVEITPQLYSSTEELSLKARVEQNINKVNIFSEKKVNEELAQLTDEVQAIVAEEKEKMEQMKIRLAALDDKQKEEEIRKLFDQWQIRLAEEEKTLKKDPNWSKDSRVISGDFNKYVDNAVAPEFISEADPENVEVLADRIHVRMADSNIQMRLAELVEKEKVKDYSVEYLMTLFPSDSTSLSSDSYVKGGTEYTNILFRIFIWEDMLRDLIDNRAWLGMSFGHPQRSLSIEIMGWARQEWARDGWITPHNSLLHYLYRGGLVGLAFLIVLFWVLFKLSFRFMQFKSLMGIFLITIFVYWIISANFTLFHEFPYNAIAFWSLLGLTVAFYNKSIKTNLPAGKKL